MDIKNRFEILNEGDRGISDSEIFQNVENTWWKSYQSEDKVASKICQREIGPLYPQLNIRIAMFTQDQRERKTTKQRQTADLKPIDRIKQNPYRNFKKIELKIIFISNYDTNSCDRCQCKGVET